jgi:hypothetical protein
VDLPHLPPLLLQGFDHGSYLLNDGQEDGWQRNQEEEQAKGRSASRRPCSDPGASGGAFVACGTSFDAIGHQLHFDSILFYGGCSGSLFICCSSLLDWLRDAYLQLCDASLLDWLPSHDERLRDWLPSLFDSLHRWHYDWSSALSRGEKLFTQCSFSAGSNDNKGLQANRFILVW